MIHGQASICCLFGTIELLGLASAWAARLSEGSSRQTHCQRLFFACLVLVGVTTVVSLGIGPGCWIASGTTLALMVVTAICDFSREPVATSVVRPKTTGSLFSA